MLAPARLRAGLQPFDLVFVDDADLSPIVFVPLSILLPHLGYGAAIESDGLDLGHAVPLPLWSGRQTLSYHTTKVHSGQVDPLVPCLVPSCLRAILGNTGVGAAVDERFATGRSLFYKELPKLRMLTKLPLAQR
jgi:hypothetical protein